MIFTVGHKDSYDSGIVEHGDAFRKLGKTESHPNITEPYGGGVAFQTREEAQSFLTERKPVGFAVYGLECEWSNTYYDADSGFNRIITGAKIVKMR